MFIREKIIETIKSSINLICKCDKEKQIQDIIGANWTVKFVILLLRHYTQMWR